MSSATKITEAFQAVGTDMKQKLNGVISEDHPTVATGKQVLWLKTVGGLPADLILVVGD